MIIVLIGLSVLIGLVGLGSLSQATQGVGMLAFAILLGVWARLYQASVFHQRSQPPKM